MPPANPVVSRSTKTLRLRSNPAMLEFLAIQEKVFGSTSNASSNR